jgi:DNA-binding transcriptional ArsR family regulator
MSAQTVQTEAEVDWEVTCEKLVHPLKMAILRDIAAMGETSPVRLSKLYEEPLGNVSHHVRSLLEEGLLEEVKTVPRRGAVEHFYRINEEILLAD